VRLKKIFSFEKRSSLHTTYNAGVEVVDYEVVGLAAGQPLKNIEAVESHSDSMDRPRIGSNLN
jgi:hypothetical protein